MEKKKEEKYSNLKKNHPFSFFSLQNVLEKYEGKYRNFHHILVIEKPQI